MMQHLSIFCRFRLVLQWTIVLIFSRYHIGIESVENHIVWPHFSYSYAQSVCMIEMDEHRVYSMRHIDDYLGDLQ